MILTHRYICVGHEDYEYGWNDNGQGKMVRMPFLYLAASAFMEHKKLSTMWTAIHSTDTCTCTLR